jgi:3-hydroxyisobutyrate dehydrogenase-like beta-hydroxyacid dehydrogenase
MVSIALFSGYLPNPPCHPNDGGMTTTQQTVSFLGLGEMGSALARAAISARHPTKVWNRSPDKATALTDIGACAATSIEDAVDLIVVCLFDHLSVHEVLDPLADRLAGRRLINLTTTSPEGARELARWAAGIGADYLDGGIMATPEMIGTPQSSILYSGSLRLYDDYRGLLELWGRAEYFSDDAGMASLYDLALLSGMYAMFAGFFHGAAMVGAHRRAPRRTQRPARPAAGRRTGRATAVPGGDPGRGNDPPLCRT